MAIPVIDLSNIIKWFAGSGTGTAADPYVLAMTGGGGGGGAGDASAANQTTEITKLTSIDGKTPALGQAVAGSSVPVVLPAAQITTLTPPAAITGFATAAKQPALGTAGTASTDVITVQGIASGTAQPVSIATAPVLVAGEAHIGEVGGNMISVAVEFTRPNDTTAYAVGDVVSDSTSATTMQAIAAAARVSGGSGYITGIRIATDKKSIVPAFRIHIFNTTGATLAVDNLAYKELYADSSKRVAYYDMPAMTTEADTTNSDMSRAIDMTVRIPYVCAVTSLYYVLETLTVFTPAALEKFLVTVVCDRN